METVVTADMSIFYLPETRTSGHPWLSEGCPGHVTHFGQLDMNEFMHSFLAETLTATVLPWPSSPTSVSYQALSNIVSHPGPQRKGVAEPQPTSGHLTQRRNQRVWLCTTVEAPLRHSFVFWVGVHLDQCSIEHYSEPIAHMQTSSPQVLVSNQWWSCLCL